MQMIEHLSYIVVPSLIVLAGILDCISFRIPNWLSGAMVAVFIVMALSAAMPLPIFGIHVAVGATLLAAGFGLFAAGMFGAGDAKLVAATGLWFGWPAVMPFLVYTAFAGGVLAILVGLWAALHVDQEVHGKTWMSRLKLTSFKPNVPYGAAIAAGAVLAYPQSWWMSG